MKHQLTDSYVQVRANSLRKSGFIQPGCRQVEICKDPAQVVAIEWVTGGFGNRAQFHCPGCDRLCGILYRRPYSKELYRCRKCCDLTYHSQRLQPHELERQRALENLKKLSQKLELFSHAQAPTTRPKYMREKTFQKLKQEFSQERARLIANVESQVSSILKVLDLSLDRDSDDDDFDDWDD